MRTLLAIESPRMGDNLVMQRTHHLHRHSGRQFGYAADVT